MIKKINELPQASQLKMVLWGLSGSGKTTSFLTLPEIDGKKWLYVSVDKSYSTISHKEDIDVIEAHTIEEFRNFNKWLRTEEYKQYAGIFIDTITEATFLYLEDIRKENEIEKFTFDEWGILKTRLQRLIRYYRDKETNIILTAQPNRITNKVTGATIISPSLEGSMNNEFPEHWDYILFSNVESEKHYWQTKPSFTTVAKDRSGILPKTIKPNWEFVFESHRLKKELYKLKSKDENKAKELYQDFIKRSYINIMGE